MYMFLDCITVAPPLSAGLMIVFGSVLICSNACLSVFVKLSVIILVCWVL